MSIHYQRATQQTVAGIGSLLIEMLRTGSLVYHRFSCEVRLVHLQVHGFHQITIGRYFFTRFKQHHIAHYQIFAWYLAHTAIAPHFHQRVFIHLVQQVEFLIGIVFEEETYARGQ